LARDDASNAQRVAREALRKQRPTSGLLPAQRLLITVWIGVTRSSRAFHYSLLFTSSFLDHLSFNLVHRASVTTAAHAMDLPPLSLDQLSKVLASAPSYSALYDTLFQYESQACLLFTDTHLTGDPELLSAFYSSLLFSLLLTDQMSVPSTPYIDLTIYT